MHPPQVNFEQIAQQHGWSDEEARARRSICEIGRICYERSLISAVDGNISVRLSDGSIVITPAGGMKGFLQMEQLARIDASGNVIGPPVKQSTETGIHLVCYQERPDVKAVLHCHPPHAVALSVAEIDMQTPIIPEMVVTIGGVDPRDRALLGHRRDAQPRLGDHRPEPARRLQEARHAGAHGADPVARPHRPRRPRAAAPGGREEAPRHAHDARALEPQHAREPLRAAASLSGSPGRRRPAPPR
jgi:hypothetical protein